MDNILPATTVGPPLTASLSQYPPPFPSSDIPYPRIAQNSMTTPWKPPPGRHTVLIGQSLNRALKARRGEPTHTKSKIPDKEFYSFRCECACEGFERNV